MASGYLALMALCCCIKGVSAAFAIVGKNNELLSQFWDQNHRWPLIFITDLTETIKSYLRKSVHQSALSVVNFPAWSVSLSSSFPKGRQRFGGSLPSISY